MLRHSNFNIKDLTYALSLSLSLSLSLISDMGKSDKSWTVAVMELGTSLED